MNPLHIRGPRDLSYILDAHRRGFGSVWESAGYVRVWSHMGPLKEHAHEAIRRLTDHALAVAFREAARGRNDRGGYYSGPLSRAHQAEHVLRALAPGGMLALYFKRVPREEAAPMEPLALPEVAPSVPSASPAKAPAPSHWSAVEVTDTEGAPAAGVRVDFEEAQGRVQPRYTDGNGRARVEGLSPGNVKLRLPELDAGLWEAADGLPSHGVTGAASETSLHTVAPGECMSRLAHRFGLAGYDALWSHPKNASLRSARKSPHVLRPGDQVAVPKPRVGELSRPPESTVRITVKRPRVRFMAVLQDHSGLPFKGRAYVLSTSPRLPEGRIQGTTDAQGKVEQELPLATKLVEITLARPALTFAFSLGKLDAPPDARPADGAPEDAQRARAAHLNAAAQRLTALGFPCEPELRSVAMAMALLRAAPRATLDDELDLQGTVDELVEAFSV